MSSNRERNDRKTGKKQGFRGRPEGPKSGGWTPNPPVRAAGDSAPRERKPKVEADNWLWGRHPVLAALANPARKGMGRLLATEDRAAEIERDRLAPNGHRVEIVDGPALARMLPAGAVHQGLAFKVQPLEGVALEDVADPAHGVIVMLDQLTDPQNVGAIFRSALAFGAKGIVVQDRHSPALAGALA